MTQALLRGSLAGREALLQQHRQRTAACSCSLAAQPAPRPARAAILSGDGQHARRLPPLAARQRRSPVIAPDITLRDGEEESSLELFNYLLRQRIVMCTGYIDDKRATQLVGSLLALEAIDEEEPIRLYINSPGGSPYSVIGVLDVMASIKPPIQTVAMGACYSYASLLLAAGTPGRRFAMKNTRIMMGQPMGGSAGSWWEVSKTVEELNALYQLISRFYMQSCGMDAERVEANTVRDFFMTPEQAQLEGLIDGIIRGKHDYSTPPSLVKDLKRHGMIDRLTGGALKVDCD